ncbi:hypothetical protein HG536_0F00840 [Torulaspora globosa]|uniref:Las1-domain-containing protein n=1 Tax=Torulaspora globosa TaxID=48254 RepID=A0A7G3ZJS3_9SACH|nr:uncharacterized protein HG536_0F00840 [Torulaspora globosa]QLL33759.1 hypothetical protein HG536_0F00840 [Torulaspora globosa]
MVHPRIVPWPDSEELVELKEWFYAEKFSGRASDMDMRTRAIQRVKCYQSKGSQYLPHVIDSTAQITSAVLLDEERLARGKDSMFAVRLSYAMALIRFVNGLLDPTQQSQFAIPLHTLAQRVGLSSWFVDLRHWGTHERELPSIDMLRMAAREALEWLWEHYWNDDELQEDENSANEEESEENEGFIAEIKRLVQAGAALEEALIEHRWVWEDGNKNLISSTNFAVEDGKTTNHRTQSTSPHQRIHGYVGDCREHWRRSTERKQFVEIAFEKGRPILFELFMAKLAGFDLEVLQWVAQSYREQTAGGKSTLLRRKYASWTELKRKYLRGYVSNLNLHNLAANWSQWEAVINEHSSFLTLWICASLLKRLQDHKCQAISRKKRRKRKQTDSFIELESRITALVERLSKRFSSSDAKLYDLPPSEHTTNTASTQPSMAGASDILSDLAGLRQRLEKPSTSRAHEIKLWDPHPNWEPRPFGIL